MIALLGMVAGALTTLSWLPQLRRTWRSREAGDISGAYLIAFGAGVAGWVAYGVLKADPAVIAANAATLLLLGGVIYMKYGRGPAPTQQLVAAPAERTAAAPPERAASTPLEHVA